MAKDLYKGRQMYQGPWLFYLLIPIGVVILMFLVDVCYKYYNEYTLNRDTKEVLYQILESDNLNTQEEYKAYAKKKYEELGYDSKNVTIVLKENYIILINYKNYFSVLGELITGKEKIAVARYKGYTNEYKEAVVEEYITEEDDNLDEVDDEENPVVIPSKN